MLVEPQQAQLARKQMPPKRVACTMTPLRFEMLRLAATEDERGSSGIPSWAYRNMKPQSKRAVNDMLKAGWLTRNAYLDIVPTNEGQRIYAGEISEQS